jgi:tagaturonate reductase
VPPSLAFGFAAYLLFVRESLRGLRAATDTDGERVRAIWYAATDDSEDALRRVVAEVCAEDDLWRADLGNLPGFVDLVGESLIALVRLGVNAALEAHLAALVSTRASTSSGANDR